MKRALRSVAVVTLGALLIVAQAQVPAWATGSFTYTGYFNHSVKGRTYTSTHNGKHRLYATTLSCPGPGSTVRVRSVHERAGLPDEKATWGKLKCDGVARYVEVTWANDTGKFHWDIEKSDTSNTYYQWKISGKITYP